MPHAVLNPGTQTASARGGARSLIPGVEPGGSRAGKTKPALLIRDLFVVVNTLTRTAGDDIDIAGIFLLLSQEQALTPALRLHLATIIGSGVGATAGMNSVQLQQFGERYVGTVWAPAFLGVQINEAAGSWNGINVDVHLMYDVVDVEWRDWFVMWEFLDNVVDNDQEF